jgi:signal transduction histidine kinase
VATARLLRGTSVDRSVEAALQTVAEGLRADTAEIFRYEDEGSRAEVCYRWRRSEETPVPPDLEADEIDSGRSNSGRSNSGRSNSGRSNGRIRDRSPEENGSDTGATAFTMSLPIEVGDAVWGKVRFSTTNSTVHWTHDEVALLTMMARNFGSVLSGTGGTGATDPFTREAVAEVIRQAADLGGLRGGVAVVGPDGQMLYQNDALMDVIGWTRNGVNRKGGLASCLQPASIRGDLRQALRNGDETRHTVVMGAGDPVSLRLDVVPIRTTDDELLCSLCWFSSVGSETPAITSEQQTLSLRRRVRAERALVEASKLLVSPGACDFDELLEIVGEATGARYAYLVVITPDDVVRYPQEGTFSDVTRQPINLDTYRQHEWFREAAPTTEEEGGPTFAVPVLSADDQLFGYLGIEYDLGSAPCRDEDARVLSVLGDMLCTYLQRQISEEALRRSEQRYRYFVDTIAEAIWRIDLVAPLDRMASTSEQVEHLLTHGVISESNAAMAELLGYDAPGALSGEAVSELLPIVGSDLLYDVIEAGFELKQHEYVVGDERPRHFVVNTVGVDGPGGVDGIWGSVTEVTERVEMERRMVEALETQQQRIGRNLHDRVSQQLAGTRMLAQNLMDRHFDEGSKGHRDVEKIISYVDEAANHVSDLQRGVMPVQVERDGLAQGLQELVSRINRMEGVRCTYAYDGRTDVSDHEAKLQLYRIAQEATRNALRHGRPDRITIRLETVDDTIVMCVSDDGAGFDALGVRRSSTALGMHSMRYRARLVGATFHVSSAPGEGTEICCVLPMG